jgi:3-phenylpropionate/cinnamic acid dioxygenase small subunit
MKNTNSKKLNEALENAEAFMEEMKLMDDKKLSKHLDLFQEQMEIAYKANNHEAYNLLYEYERQTIEARVRKNF